MILYIVLAILVLFFALNMGGSNFAASFAAAHGSGIISKRKAGLLFCLFVVLGAVMFGRPVTETLGKKIIPETLIDIEIAVIIIFSAALSIWLANLLHVPQSTSLVTVSSIAGVGVYFRQVYTDMFLYMMIFWILLPVAGYFLSYMLGRLVYPPRKNNFWLYEKLINHHGRLKAFVIFACCFNAFSVGTNNVANAVGPLVGVGLFGSTVGLILLAPVFGLGSFVFKGSLRTTSEEIVPLGLLTGTIICLVTGSLVLIASLLGIPQSLVMIKVASIFAIGSLKNGHRSTFSNPVTRKTYLVWVISPIVAFFISYAAVGIRHSMF